MERNLNDTIKYDFRIAPERVATGKQHFGLGLGLRNEKGLWGGGLLRTYFRLNGIYHPDDMSAIVLTTLHRKLNNKPIKFKEQKDYYKEYWKVASISVDSALKWHEEKHPKKLRDSLYQLYYSNFSRGRLVLGSIGAWTPMENGSSSGIDLKMIAEVITIRDHRLKIKILEIAEAEKGYEHWEKIGDTIETSPFSVCLIPPKSK